jgi:hypothetical protein
MLEHSFESIINVGTFLSSTKVPEQMDAELSAINSEANED